MDNRSGTVVKILGWEVSVRAADWCTNQYGETDRWDLYLYNDQNRYSEWVYEFVFESESDAVWFALVHGEHLYRE